MSKKKTYVIGTNVSTSLSPVIFEHWFQKYDVDAEYGFIEIKEENFDQEIKPILKKENLVGLNITIPFKEKIPSYLTDSCSWGAKGPHDHSGIDYGDYEKERLGHFNKTSRETKLPINCVTINKNKIIGTNTDWMGFKKTYLKHTEKTKNLNTKATYKLALVLGYGGAAKAIVYSLVNVGFDEIIIFNRTFNKIKNTSMFFEGTEGVQNCKVRAEKIENLIKYINYESFGERQPTIVVNTTPINPLNANTNWNVDTNTKGFDIVYRPRKGTGFLENFNPDFRIEGIQMLVYQAVPCFRAWFGFEPEVDEELFSILYKKMDDNK